MTIRILAAALAAVLLSIPSALAVTTFSYTAVIENGRFAGQTGTGTVTYDETLLPSLAELRLTPELDPLFSVTLDLFGQAFSTTDDEAFPAFPRLTFAPDFTPEELIFVVFEGGSQNPADIAEPGIFGFAVQGDLIGSVASGFTNTVSVFEDTTASVPLPGAFFLLLSSALLLGFATRPQRG